jgi:hypothetical protein
MPARRLHDEKAHEAAIKRQMAGDGGRGRSLRRPVTKCSPDAARAEESVKAKLLLRPRGKRSRPGASPPISPSCRGCSPEERS